MRNTAGQFAPRREIRPDDLQMGVATDVSEIPNNDPGYHYRWVGKDDMEGLAKRREQGYEIAFNAYRRVRVGLPKDVAEERTRASQKMSTDRVNAKPTETGDKQVTGGNLEPNIVNDVTVKKGTIKFEDQPPE